MVYLLNMVSPGEGRDNWFEAYPPVVQTFDLYDNEPSPEQTRESKRGPAIALVCVLGAMAAAAGLEFTVFAPKTPKADRLAALIEANHYDPQTPASVRYLRDLTPRQVDEGVIRDRVAFGKKIQDAAVRSSLGAYRQGLDNQGWRVDMFDVATQLIPEPAQAELKKDGVKFVGEAPVSCVNIYGSDVEPPYSPLDYTNHMPSAFKVRTFNVAGRQVTFVPMGTEQVTGTGQVEYPKMNLDFLHSQPYYGLSQMQELLYDFQAPYPSRPCIDAFPPKTYGPNHTTYPYQDIKVELY